MAVNGIRMHYQRHGQGGPLLLLHGFTGAGGDWAPFVEPLSREHELIIPDLRGHGRSTNPSGTYTHRQAALDVLAMLDRLEVGSVKAIGVSGGANALLHMATRPVLIVPRTDAHAEPVQASAAAAGADQG